MSRLRPGWSRLRLTAVPGRNAADSGFVWQGGCASRGAPRARRVRPVQRSTAWRSGLASVLADGLRRPDELAAFAGVSLSGVRIKTPGHHMATGRSGEGWDLNPRSGCPDTPFLATRGAIGHSATSPEPDSSMAGGGARWPAGLAAGGSELPKTRSRCRACRARVAVRRRLPSARRAATLAAFVPRTPSNRSARGPALRT